MIDNERIKELTEKAAGGVGSVGRAGAQFKANAELLGEMSSDLATAIGHLTAAFQSASEASDRSAKRMASLTKVLVAATVFYTVLTGGGLAVSVLGEPKIACVGTTAAQQGR